MKGRPATPAVSPGEYSQSLFRIIDAGDYPRYGIDPQDVPIGTFAAEDHPNFLTSRSGGNAYGLGLIEQNRLTRDDFDFLQQLDFEDQPTLAANSRRINQIYQQLGLLIRFSRSGRRYFLIPINLVAHSLEDVTSKADEIEKLVLQHILETGTERLDIGLMASPHDLLVHELRARLSIHRLFLFESLDKIRSWRTLLDLVILTRNPVEFLLEQFSSRAGKRASRRRRLHDYGTYLAAKIYDILEPQGKWVVLAQTALPRSSRAYQVTFHDPQEWKQFLIFTHVFKMQGHYSAGINPLVVETLDLFHYLHRFGSAEPHRRRLLRGKQPERLSDEEIDRLPHLNLRLPNPEWPEPEEQWGKIFGTYFDTLQLSRISSQHHAAAWQDKLSLDQPFPADLLVYLGRPRRPLTTLTELQRQLVDSGLLGCPLPLVAEYRNTFRYLLDVLATLGKIRDKHFDQASELEADRLRTPFHSRRWRYDGFNAIHRLVQQIGKLRRISQGLNPDQIEGQDTPVVENLEKLALHGFTEGQLSEMLLIIAGHSTMSRVAFGKLPPASLNSVTDPAASAGLDHTIEVLRFCRLMSVAESAAALGELYTRDHLRELFDLYRDAVQVASSPHLDWQRLKDLRISELGGVEHAAVRQMMKFFNLFEFLNNWKDFEHKGRFEREVFCNYDSPRLERLQETLNLAEVAAEFKARFVGSRVSSQSYFFRQFLESEFHGTGHLFPALGARAGFVLLWITVNAAQRRIINFNPMLARIGSDRQSRRIAKIRTALLQISYSDLQPYLFESLRKTLADGHPAFVLDTGLRLMANVETKAVDVSFVDVDENIVQIQALLDHFETRKLRGIGLKEIQDLERLFAELESYRYYLDHQHGRTVGSSDGDPPAQMERNRRIQAIEARLKTILYEQVFVPEEIFDTLSVLAAHCGEILRFILPEFHAFGALVDNWPTRKKQSVGSYVMRSLEKFQALISKDRDTFQDRETFYQLAKREFGPLAEEDIGAKHAQLETLEHMVDRIQRTPALYRALTIALLFQDLGKVDQFRRHHDAGDECLPHAEAGAAILEATRLLENYALDEPVRQQALALIRHHGIFGHVIQGEEPITALEAISRNRDSSLADAFALHSILAAAAVEEGLMTEDLLDRFLFWYRQALRIITEDDDWSAWLQRRLAAKVRAMVADPQAVPKEIGALWLPQRSREGALGAPAADSTPHLLGFERLLRLLEVRWVDLLDLQMHLSKVPFTFIYHKKPLKSLGPQEFERQLQRAARALQHLFNLDETSRIRLLSLLDPLDGGLRIYDFHPLNRFLEVEECIKLLLIALDAFACRFPNPVSGGLISFRPISQNIERRYGALRSLLRESPSAGGCAGPDEASACTTRHWGGLRFQAAKSGCALHVGFQDALQLDQMIRSLSAFQSPEAITRHYFNLLQELKKLPYDTDDYERRLRRAYERQCREINNRLLRQMEQRLTDCRNLSDLDQIKALMETTLANRCRSDEQEFLLREIFEYNRRRLLNQTLEEVQQAVCRRSSAEELITYWQELKSKMMAHRNLIGKEYELLIARLVDERLAAWEPAFERCETQASTGISSLSGKVK